MYLSADAVLRAIDSLRAEVHPFVGITFVACKRHNLSVGSMDDVSIDMLTRAHLEMHHRIDRRTSFYFQPFRSAFWWVSEKYYSGGLQTINTQTFPSVFIHTRAKRKWGFQPTYLDEIETVLGQQNVASRVPADALAVWLYKDADIGNVSSYEELAHLFFDEFNITSEEQSRLFSERVMGDELPNRAAFVSEPIEMTAVTHALPEPPDVEAEGGRTIASLRLTNAGPAREMLLEFGQRLTIITGDNGLGKSFLLDFAWWAATGIWAEKEALPRPDGPKAIPQIEYTLSGGSGRLSSFTARFDQKNFAWTRSRSAMTVEALAVFSRADGSFAIADPIRSKFNQGALASGSLTAYEVWNGRPGLIEGLIRDWTRWQTASDKKTFDQFASVLKRLSPEDLGTLIPGPTIRLPRDPRDIPTIQHRYGTVPVTHASSGVQRVLLLAYLIIWSWQEHELAAERLDRAPLHRMMVVVDELEAHLHPKWQRIVLPALMGVGDLLSSDLAIQMIAATHSPMILASMEASFDPLTDVLYHLYGAGPTVKLEETAFVKYGDASGWLTSPLFGLRHARSREAELAIEDAKQLQLSSQPSSEEVAAVSDRLRVHLAADDKFWPRWLFFAEEHGVKI
jgi:hypothetical protein